MELTISDETSVNMEVKPRYTTLAVTAGCHQRPFGADDADDAVPALRTSFSDGYNGNSAPQCSSERIWLLRAGRQRKNVARSIAAAVSRCERDTEPVVELGE